MLFHFTVPMKFDRRDAYGFAGKHPLGDTITYDDWFDVEADSEVQARQQVVGRYGSDCFFTCYVDGPEWEANAEFHPGECKATIDVRNN